MRLVAIAMVRDESDLLVPWLEHLLAEGADEVLAADNLSEDGTREMLHAFAKHHPVTVIHDDVPAYAQSLKMTTLARRAYDEGADFVWPADADELFSAADPSLTVKQALESCGAEIVQTFGYDYIAQRSDPKDEPNPFLRIEHRRAHTQTLAKVVFRSAPNAMLHPGNHDVARDGRRVDGILRMGHWQFRSLEQMSRKVRQGKLALEAGGIHKGHGSHWRRLGALSDEDLKAEWERLLDEPGLVLDPAPWRPL